MNPLNRSCLVLACVVLLTGCQAHVAALNPRPPGTIPMGNYSLSDQECKELHEKVVFYTALAAGLGVLAGGTGLATAVFDSSTPRYVTGSASLGAGVSAAIVGVLQKFAADDFSKGCKITQ